MAHIAFASYEVSPVTPGGVGTFVAAITAALLRDGHRVSLLLDLNADEFAAWQQRAPIPSRDLERLHSFRVHDMCAGLTRTPDEFPSVGHWKSFQFAHCLRSLHARMPVDLVEFFDYCGPAYYSLAGRLAEPAAYPARIAVRLHNTIEVIDRRVGNAFRPFRVHDYALERAAIGLADMVLTPGLRFWQDEAASLYPVSPERVRLSFPVRPPLPFRADARNGRDVVFVGRISTLKGIDRMLHAAVAALQDPVLTRLLRRFVLIGPEETVSSSLDERQILAIARDVPAERLFFAGRLGEAAMLDHFAEAAVAIFPNRMDSFCYAAHEAHTAGVPVILSDTPAFRDHFTHDDTALFFDNTIPGLLDQLRRVLQDADLRQRLSESVRPRLERYQRHDYADHLNGPAFCVSEGAEAKAADVSIVVVPLATDQANARATGSALAAALPSATVRVLAAVDRGARLQAFGRGWTVHRPDGGEVLPQAERLRPAVVFVAAEDAIDPAFIARAAAMLQREPRLGAVVPGCVTIDGSRHVSAIPTTLDRAGDAGVPLISAVLATGGQASLVDLCADVSPLTEVAVLLRLRAAGRILVDDPTPALTRHAAAIAGSRAAQAAFLQRNAWWLDRTGTTDALATMTQLADAITVTDPAGWNSAELLEHVRVSRHGDSFALHAVPSGSPEGAVTVLTLRRAAGAPPVDWTEIAWSGDWERPTAWDRPSGMPTSRNGWGFLRGATDPEITLLSGPGQGEAVLVWRGRALRVRLVNESYRAVCLRIADLLALWPETPQGHPLRLTHTSVIKDSHVDVLTGALGDGTAPGVFVLDEADVVLAEAIGGFAPATVVPATLRQPSSRLVAAFAIALARARARSLALIGGAEWLPLIEGLLEDDAALRVALYLRPGITWRGNGWEGMRTIAAAAGRLHDRLALHVPPGVVQDALTRLGAPTRPFTIRLPVPRVRPTGEKVALVFAPAPSEVPALGHLAAAAAIVARRGTPIDGVYIPDWEAQVDVLLESYGLGPLVHQYGAVKDVLATLRGRRFLYLAPFPDGAVPGTLLSAFLGGGLALTAAGCLDFMDAGIRETLSVTLWEDAEVLATHIAEAIARYGQLAARLAPSDAGVVENV